MEKNNGIVEVGDYVSFDNTNKVIYKVLDIHEYEDRTYILMEDYITNEEVWERLEYVTNVFKISKKISCEE